MAFPSISPLRISSFEQRPNTENLFAVNGFPYSIVSFSDVKHVITAQYLLSTANWDLLKADFEDNHSTEFTWTDTRDNTVRAVRYAGQPFRTRLAPEGVTKPGTFFVTVELVEVRAASGGLG